MKSKLFGLLVLLLSGLAIANETDKSILSQAPLFYDGKGFFTYNSPINEEKLPDGKLKVVYFFDYECASCISADDYLKEYARRNPEKIELVRYPYFNKGRIFVARLHAAFEILGKSELSALYMFESEGKKGNASLVHNEQAIEKWLKQHDVDLVVLKTLLNSGLVKEKVAEYTAIYQKYRPIVAPFVSINGKYVLLQSTLYNDDYTYAVLDHLYENRHNPDVLGYKPPKKEETSKEKETK